MSERKRKLIRMAMTMYNEKYNKEDYDNLRSTPSECKEMFSSFSYNDTSSVEIGEAVNRQTTEGAIEPTPSESHDLFLDIETSTDEYNPSDDSGSSSDEDDGGKIIKEPTAASCSHDNVVEEDADNRNNNTTEEEVMDQNVAQSVDEETSLRRKRKKAIKSRRLRWAGHVARTGESRKAYRVSVGRPEGKRPLGRRRRRREDNIKMDLREVGCDDGDWINLALDKDRWRAYFKVCHGSLYAVMWLVDEPREFNLPTPPQRYITYVPEKLPSKYGVHSEELARLCDELFDFERREESSESQHILPQLIATSGLGSDVFQDALDPLDDRITKNEKLRGTTLAVERLAPPGSGLGAPCPWSSSGYSSVKRDQAVSGAKAECPTCQRRIQPGHLSDLDNNLVYRAQWAKSVFAD
ncbi:hypothetical protein ANN_19816 [Periplaneta americana]|uniref:Uncharacterized protein n=1 Tax=Periplaneta americana TaxID=6978 RepID=A0ABQ8SAW4_PERAM|nr:hypothetical protein ANN_19816 [Periplaneta americana]